jgi:hypothetical protein
MQYLLRRYRPARSAQIHARSVQPFVPPRLFDPLDGREIGMSHLPHKASATVKKEKKKTPYDVDDDGVIRSVFWYQRPVWRDAFQERPDPSLWILAKNIRMGVPLYWACRKRDRFLSANIDRYNGKIKGDCAGQESTTPRQELPNGLSLIKQPEK